MQPKDSLKSALPLLFRLQTELYLDLVALKESYILGYLLQALVSLIELSWSSEDA